MTEKGGKTRFSADFMAKLERILGRDVFKAADFKLNRDGSVSSGKPLTQRRIQAIVEKAGIYANTGFSVGAYRQKLESIKKDLGIAGLSGAQLDALNKNEKTPSMTKLFISATTPTRRTRTRRSSASTRRWGSSSSWATTCRSGATTASSSACLAPRKATTSP